LVAAVVLAAVGAVFYEDLSRLTGDQNAAATEVQDLETRLARLDEENRALRERLVIMERSAQVKAAAYRQVEENLVTVERELARLREELAFYKGVMAETVKPGTLSIYSVSLRPAGEARRFRYELVLTRMGKSGKVVTGSVGLSVTGDGADGEQTLSHDALSSEGSDRPRFRFSHFQRIEGTLSLPEGFTPRTLRVEVEADGKGTGRVERKYDWQGLSG
jgi:hypothetical protein